MELASESHILSKVEVWACYNCLADDVALEYIIAENVFICDDCLTELRRVSAPYPKDHPDA